MKRKFILRLQILPYKIEYGIFCNLKVFLRFVNSIKISKYSLYRCIHKTIC